MDFFPENYLERFRKIRELSFLNNLPWKKIETFPKSGNEGLYGWTYLQDTKIHLREDLIGEKKIETEIHESIHTNDERETRYLTAWIMEILFSQQENKKYKK